MIGDKRIYRQNEISEELAVGFKDGARVTVMSEPWNDERVTVVRTRGPFYDEDGVYLGEINQVVNVSALEEAL